MFEKVSQFAEQVATSVSRRAFLGRFAQGAFAFVAAVGGVLAIPVVAQAGSKCKHHEVTCSAGPFGGFYCCPPGSICCNFHDRFTCCPSPF